MKACEKTLGVLALLVLIVLFLAPAMVAAAVEVKAEGAYDDTSLVVYIYANTDTEELRSAGVKLAYDSTKLELISAEKNEAVWFMGTASDKFSYMDPETVEGGVITILGKLDTEHVDQGVTGDRVLLAKIVFNRSDAGVNPGDAPEDYFGISLSLGKLGADGKFVNFVNISGDNLDDTITFSAIVRERGDANKDGFITSADMFTIRTLIGSSYSVFADCNKDNFITSADMFCVRGKL